MNTITNNISTSNIVIMPLQFINALEFAAKQHTNQRRKNKAQTPYINHPIELVHILHNQTLIDHLGSHVADDIYCAAVLHDTIEDTGCSANDIQQLFGSFVTSIVLECTDDKSLSKVDRKKNQISHAKTISKYAQYVKLADKYSNLQNLLADPPESWSPEIIHGYLIWAAAVIRSMIDPDNKYTDRKFLTNDDIPYVENKLVFLLLDLFEKNNINVFADNTEALNAYYDVLAAAGN